MAGPDFLEHVQSTCFVFSASVLSDLTMNL